MEIIVSRNPATGTVLKEIPVTPIESLPQIFNNARNAQEKWAAVLPKRRADILIQLRETIINRADSIIEIISQENGKPKFEAMANEIIPTVDLITYFAHHGPGLLGNRRIPMAVMKHRISYLQHWPVGVTAVISPWNYPFLLPMGEIVMSVLAGNAVLFKPSEVTPLVGLKIQEICDEAGIPYQLLQTVIGDGAVGAALIQNKPGKVFFTGSVATGKKIMAAAAEHLIPVNLELGGKDAMIVLADADLDYATSAALWGGFSNSGQVCASVERILVHESIAADFTRMLKEKIATLRQGPPAEGNIDLGAVTFEKQKLIYDRHIQEARQKGAEFITGGEFSSDRRFLQPTVVSGSDIETLSIFNEETFGPVVALTTFRSIDEAVRKANKSPYGLLASVITRDIARGEQVARQLEVGTVTINEVTYTAGLAETPWGGVKDSGFGKKHSAQGLMEFVNVSHIHKPRSSLLVFKSPWWFPYTEFQYTTFKYFLELYRKNWLDKLKAFPHFLWNFVQMVKREKRL